MHRRVDRAALPDDRVVVQFDHTEPDKLSIWMVFDRGEPSVCVQHPGFEPDLVVRTSTPAMAEVFQGYATWVEALEQGRITLAGPPRLLRELPRWFSWSVFAEDTRRRIASGEPPSGPTISAA